MICFFFFKFLNVECKLKFKMQVHGSWLDVLVFIVSNEFPHLFSKQPRIKFSLNFSHFFFSWEFVIHWNGFTNGFHLKLQQQNRNFTFCDKLINRCAQILKISSKTKSDLERKKKQMAQMKETTLQKKKKIWLVVRMQNTVDSCWKPISNTNWTNIEAKVYCSRIKMDWSSEL